MNRRIRELLAVRRSLAANPIPGDAADKEGPAVNVLRGDPS
jgi:hypothetical protein